ncbi:MAG: hypothetical protein ACRC7P_04690 [Enterovibrio sp.]
MPRKQLRHVSLTTLLIVGEGSDDKAFIEHLRTLFVQRNGGRKVTIKAGDGGSPGNIITHASRAYKAEGYDLRYLVLDSDIPLTAANISQARKAGYEILLWKPQCLEGALLEVLGEKVQDHETSLQLKSRLHPRLAAHHTKPEAYAKLFDQQRLAETKNASVVSICRILQDK